ncbi:protein WVD2-like 5, partial [Arachis ipaensis]|uniref:protein WVD2-like 5 n=1 Tax=Arachis ipaensis TaxID=130454 RepID=UPI000A2B63F2
MASPNGNVENFDELDGAATDNSSVVEIREVANGSSNGNNVDNSNDEDVTTVEDQSRQLRAQKGPVKEKCAKPTGSKGVHANSVKRCKDGKDEHASSAVSNGTSASEPHPRQPAKLSSYNDKETRLSKHPGKSDPVSSEVPLDKAKPRSLKKGPAENVQGGTECSSPTAEDAKHRRVGALPNYGFSFKCDERAERRKQFYSKLEEKIHAKEVEESNLQAKTKETQEAEIKMLRKSLAFKATPMPSFYQEPTPPRVELKKIPTTRAKSPKLGRRKSATHPGSEGDAISSAQVGRLSLDEKASQST